MAADDKQFQRMNQALDDELPAHELEALQKDISAVPDTAEHWRRLRTADHLLRATPMIQPSSGFAERVLAALTAVPLPGFAHRHPGVGIALGLALAALLAVPALWLILWLLISLLTDPGALTSLLEAIIGAVTAVAGVAWDAITALRGAARETPLLAVLLALSIPLTAFWAWLVWVLLGGPPGLWRRR